MSAIRVKDVTKVYKLYNKTLDRLYEAIHPLHRKYHKAFYALKNISFQVEKGETVGIIGSNGSGKSTMLKIITGVLKNTSGEVEVSGKVSALLELGAGFDIDYTGIENIYLNGSIIGYSREEMDQKKEEILKFADIGDFVYQPVKTYSSGMMVRLAFALAINVEPEILIIDEALAVGDAFFQAKCFAKLEEIRNMGTTILFVSHDVVSVKKLCSKVVWIEKGEVKDVGEAKEICEKYLSSQIDRNNQEKIKKIEGMELRNVTSTIQAKENNFYYFKKLDLSKAASESGTKEGEIISFYIRNEEGAEVTLLEPKEFYTFGLVAGFHKNLKNVLFGFELENARGVKLFSINNFLSDEVIKSVEVNEIFEVKFHLQLPGICTGEYLLSPSLAVGNQNDHVVLHRIHNCIKVDVSNAGYNLALLEVETKNEFIRYCVDEVVLV